MEKYKCKCGWVYDPAKGDPKANIKPGTPFEELPESYKCPECGEGKSVFTKCDKKDCK